MSDFAKPDPSCQTPQTLINNTTECFCDRKEQRFNWYLAEVKISLNPSSWKSPIRIIYCIKSNLLQHMPQRNIVVMSEGGNKSYQSVQRLVQGQSNEIPSSVVTAQQGSFIWAGIHGEQKPGQPRPNTHSQNHRQLSTVVFCLDKLGWGCRYKHHVIVFSSWIFIYYNNFLSSPSSIRPSSLLSSFLMPLFPSSTHPHCWELWLLHWIPGSALNSHMTQIQRCGLVKYKALHAFILHRQEHQKATVVLHIWTEKLFTLVSAALDPLLTRTDSALPRAGRWHLV